MTRSAAAAAAKIAGSINEGDGRNTQQYEAKDARGGNFKVG